MIAEPYSETVRALFARPAHAGSLPDAVVVRIDDQGVSIELSAKLQGDRIRALRFHAWGCPHVIAAAEAFCADFEDRPAGALDDFTATDIIRRLPVPVEKTGRILVIEDAVRSLGDLLRKTS